MAKIVYLGMIGDIMHPGYINIINEATKYGDVMIGLFTDKAIANHRKLPYLTWEQRKTVIEQIKGVSEVVAQDDWSYVPNLIEYKPDYIIHGDDWQYGPDKYIRDEVFKVMENEKYAFRCFLLRLGFIGQEYKTTRKVLMKNLEGNAAWKNK